MTSIPYFIAHLVAFIFLSFGLNAIFRPESALAVLPLSASVTAETTINALIYLYGVRDIFMGLAIEAAAITGTRKTLGYILIAGTGVALGDGIVVKGASPGEGNEWGHWSYSPLLAIVGAWLIGGW